MGFTESIETVGKVIDALGVAAIALGGLLAAGIAIGRLLRRNPDTYRLFRGQLGRAILLGLELLVAADIIRTVAITPSMESVGVLAGIVLIRTFLSWSLELEITGRWPWQKWHRGPADSAPTQAEGSEPPVGPAAPSGRQPTNQ